MAMDMRSSQTVICVRIGIAMAITILIMTQTVHLWLEASYRVNVEILVVHKMVSIHHVVDGGLAGTLVGKNVVIRVATTMNNVVQIQILECRQVNVVMIQHMKNHLVKNGLVKVWVSYTHRMIFRVAGVVV